jgi:hypothetical protein
MTGRDLDAQIKEQGDKVLSHCKVPRPERRMPCTQPRAMMLMRDAESGVPQVRELKAAKASKDEISAAVEVSLHARRL